MKKILCLTALAATVVSGSVLAEDIATSRNYTNETLVSSKYVTNDTLLSQGTADQVTSDIATVLVPNDKARNAVHSFAVRWVEANAKLEAIKAKKANKEKLTKNEENFLKASHSDKSYAERLNHHLKYRIEGMKRAHNWTGALNRERQYNYEYLQAPNDKDGHTNSYAWNVLHKVETEINANVAEIAKKDSKDITVEMIDNAILAPMEEASKVVNNDELRYYIDDVVWFASMQSVKEMYFVEGAHSRLGAQKYQPGID